MRLPRRSRLLSSIISSVVGFSIPILYADHARSHRWSLTGRLRNVPEIERMKKAVHKITVLEFDGGH